MYNIFYYDIRNLNDETFKKELDLLPKIRQKEILKKSDINAQKRSLVGDMLIKKYLSKIYQVSPEKIEIRKGEHGKPYVLNLPAHFNVSHSGNYTVLAVSDAPIGIDLEIIKEFSAILAKKLFSEEELKYISGKDSKRSKGSMQQCFYEIWTAKEAYLKFKGVGLSGGIKSLELGIKENRLEPLDKSISLEYDYSIPGAVMAIVREN